MFKKEKVKKQEPYVVVSFDMDRLDRLHREIESFMNNISIDDHYVDKESITIDILSDGNIKIYGKAICHIDANISI